MREKLLSKLFYKNEDSEMAQEKIIRVLIIDDDQGDAMILQRLLGPCCSRAIETEYAENLHQALEKLSQEKVDIVLLDNRLGGGMTAQDVLLDFKAKNISVPVVVCTGTTDQETAVALMKTGAYDYIVKDTLTSQMLEKTVLNAVERHTLQDRQKQTEELIRQQKELLANVISNIPYFVFWKDRNSVYLGCNENFARVAGVDSAEDIVGKTDYELAWRKQEADLFIRCDKQILESGEAVLDIEESQLQADGKEAVLLTSKVPLRDSEGNIIGLLGIYTDITERKMAEHQMEDLNRQLKGVVEKLTISNRELNDFAHAVAHDLKSPLRAIGTLADLILRDYSDKLDEEGKELSRLLAERARRMSRLMDAVLEYSGLMCMEANTEAVDLNEFFNEVICAVAPPENVKIIVSGGLPTIVCDKARLKQVLQNLLDNAIKHGGESKGRIRIDVLEEECFWRFSVADSGPGIEERYYEKIFKIFQTLTPRDETESTGVGLSVVKKIVESSGGKVWVESRPGAGSVFFFTLPKQKSEVEDAGLEVDIACGR